MMLKGAGSSRDSTETGKPTGPLVPKLRLAFGLATIILVTAAVTPTIVAVVGQVLWTWVERGNWIAALSTLASAYLAWRPPKASRRDIFDVDGILADPVRATDRRIVRSLWTEVLALLDQDDERRKAAGEKTQSRKEIAAAVGVARGTLNRWLRRQHHVPAQQQFSRLIQTLGADPQDWETRWAEAKAAHARLTATKRSKSPVGTRGDARGVLAALRARPLLVTTAVLTGMGLGIGVMVWSSLVDQGRTWQATVVNTYSEARRQDVGVPSYRGPYHSPNDKTEVASYFENYPIRVVCKVEGGRPVTDPSRGLTSRTWYRLDDETYLPGLYVDAPSGVPNCGANDWWRWW